MTALLVMYKVYSSVQLTQVRLVTVCLASQLVAGPLEV
jgi:hypothetical protein